MPASAEARELAHLCRRVGGNLLLVQAAGGNASVKSGDGERMWVKASGVRMSEVSESHGQVTLRAGEVRALVGDAALARKAAPAAQLEYTRRIREATEGTLRASLETGFHALLGRVVLHTHAVAALAFACLEDGRARLEKALSQPCAWVPYAAPGYALTVAVDRAIESFRRDHGRAPRIVVLQNHGLITSGDDAEEVLAATADVEWAAARAFGRYDQPLVEEPPSAKLVAWAEELVRALGDGATARPARYRELSRAADEPARWLGGNALVPDDVVFGVQATRIAAGISAAEWRLAHPDLPTTFAAVLPHQGVVLSGPLLADLEEMLLAHVMVRRWTADHGRTLELPASDVVYLLDMESEQHRRQIAAGSCRS
jgi:ribulose-5-phosphate 4-epimerase/fuculose-1-phosphate aldolase